MPGRPGKRILPRRSSDPAAGTFITFEGVEGSGKSSRCVHLACELADRGYSVVHTREPGGPPAAERIRELLLEPDVCIDPVAELMLYLAARAANVTQVVRPALDDGSIVLCERFSDATFAYQVSGRGLPGDRVAEADRLATGGLLPDLTVLLDLDPAEGFRRLERENRSLDRIEVETLEFHNRVRQGYLELAESRSRFFTLDATLPEPVQDRLILDRVIRLLEEGSGKIDRKG